MRRAMSAISTVLVLSGLLAPALGTAAPPAARDDRHVEATIPAAPFGGPVDDGVAGAVPIDSPAEGAGFPDEPAAAGVPVWPGLLHDVRTTAVGADRAPVDVQILSTDATSGEVALRPVLAGGSVRGLAPVPVQSGDPLRTGRVAGINGGFWMADPLGEPNGYFALEGRLVSESETQGAGPRGTVAWTADRRFVFGRVRSELALHLVDGSSIPVAGVNRGRRPAGVRFADGDDALLAYTEDFGGPVLVTRPGPGVPVTVVRLSIAGFPSAGRIAGTIAEVLAEQEGTFVTEPGSVVLVATGRRATALAAAGAAQGQAADLETVLVPLDGRDAETWRQVVEGLAVGPLVVRDGQPVDAASWEDEGFAPDVHSDVRAPRSAIGLTDDNRLLLVTADGRRPGITVGFTMAELAAYLIALGAREGLSLDGGASSQLVVDGILRNVPCCDTSTRAVADSLHFVHRYPFAHTDRVAGPGRVDTAAAAALAAAPDGAREALVAAAGSFADALTGGPLSSDLGAPLLLVGQDSVPQVTLDAFAALGVARVTVLGGEGAVGPAVPQQLSEAGFSVRRLAGGSRTETAVALAEARERPPSRAFLAWSGGFADALTAAAPGGILGMPILLTDTNVLHPATAAWLDAASIDEVVLVGGEARLGERVEADLRAAGHRVTRLAGASRYGTAAEVQRWASLQDPRIDGTTLVVASGEEFPDALAGGPFAASRRQLLHIVPGPSIYADPEGAEHLRGPTMLLLDRVTVLGGLGALSSYQQRELDELAGGTALPGVPLPIGTSPTGG